MACTMSSLQLHAGPVMRGGFINGEQNSSNRGPDLKPGNSDASANSLKLKEERLVPERRMTQKALRGGLAGAGGAPVATTL